MSKWQSGYIIDEQCLETGKYFRERVMTRVAKCVVVAKNCKLSGDFKCNRIFMNFNNQPRSIWEIDMPVFDQFSVLCSLSVEISVLYSRGP